MIIPQSEERLVIRHRSDPDATYEYRNYIYYDDRTKAWAFCRKGEVVRWLNKYEVDMIESVLKVFNEEYV